MILTQTKILVYDGSTDEAAAETDPASYGPYTYVNLHSISVIGGNGNPIDAVIISDSSNDPVGPTFSLEVRTDAANDALPYQMRWEGIQFRKLNIDTGATPAEVIAEISFG